MNELQRNKLLRALGEDNVSYNELIRQQVDYVYKQAVLLVGDDFTAVSSVLAQVAQEIKLTRRSHRLRPIYNYLKQNAMYASGRYDYSSKRVPINLSNYDKGNKV